MSFDLPNGALTLETLVKRGYALAEAIRMNSSQGVPTSGSTTSTD